MFMGFAAILFLSLGFFGFWGALRVYSARFATVHQRTTAASQEVAAAKRECVAVRKTYDSLLREKTGLVEETAALTQDRDLVSLQLEKRKEQKAQLESEVASLADQDKAVALRAEVEGLNKERTATTEALRLLNKQVEETGISLRTVEDEYNRQKQIRMDKLDAELVEHKRAVQHQIKDELARFKELKMTETKSALDSSKIAAVRTIQKWWDAEKKNLATVFQEEYNKMRDEYREKLRKEAAAEFQRFEQILAGGGVGRLAEGLDSSESKKTRK